MQPSTSASLLGWLALALLLHGCGDSGAPTAQAQPGASGETAARVARRGEFTETLLLTGELVADQGFEVAVPRTPSSRVQIRWLIEDGSEVEAGDRLVELDNSSFTSDLEERRLSLAQTVSQLKQQKMRLEVEEADRRQAVASRRAELAKARDKAAVPPELVSRRQLEEGRLALRRAELELAKAVDDLAAKQRAAAAEIAEKQVELDTLRRDIEVSERAILQLTARAPSAGVALVADHPWEGRKLQEGETVWIGMPLVRLPDLASMVIEAALPDVDDGRLQVGATARLTLDAYPDESFLGHVREMALSARQENGDSLRHFFRVVIEPERVDLDRMRPGMSVKVEAEGRHYANAVLVPRTAVELDGEGQPEVFLASGDRQAVKLGACDRHECVVESGLEVGVALSVPSGASSRSAE